MLIINNHPRAQQQSEDETGPAESGRGGERGDVLGRVFVLEDVGADDAHEVGQRDGDGGEEDAAAFVGDVVVVPLGAGEYENLKLYSLRGTDTYDVKQHRRR